MGDDAAVRLVGVAKKYRLFSSPRERLMEAVHPFRKIYHREHWALRDVDLTFRRGSTVGILGVNGSGKSTLLQIVSGVLRPTTGTVQVNGRIAALLELGAGFNPDLTGRENVITNALIMGLDGREFDSRLAEVEAFADIGVFFDQPVKTYSSGMFMRVAFAMSIHVDPEILIIDEALAVGDAQFQEKCFRRFREFQRADKTILYVTHDRASVTHLCSDAVLLHAGRVVASGEPDAIVEVYVELLTTGRLPGERPLLARQPSVTGPAGDAQVPPLTQPAAESSPDDPVAQATASFCSNHDPVDRLAQNPLYNANETVFGHGGARVIDALVVHGQTINPAQIISGAEVDIYLRILFEEDFHAPLVGMTLTNTQGVVVYATHSGWLKIVNRPAEAGSVHAYRIRLCLPLSVGSWFVELAVALSDNNVACVRSKALMLNIMRGRMMQGLVDLEAAFAEIGVPAGRRVDGLSAPS